METKFRNPGYLTSRRSTGAHKRGLAELAVEFRKSQARSRRLLGVIVVGAALWFGILGAIWMLFLA